jgi:DNA repair protein RecO (recombination protein O)
MTPLLTPAVVINVTDYGESDKIVTFYTQKYGKLAGIAKGAKRSKKRFLNKLEFFSLIDIRAIPNKHSNLLRVDQAELIDPYPILRESLKRYAGAMLICDLIRLWTKENDQDPHLFDLLLWGLDSLNKKHTVIDVVIFFQLRMLKILGYQLNLDTCVHCGIMSPKADFSFSATYNGLVCTNCNTVKSDHLSTLSLNTIKTLEMGQSLSLKKLSRLKFSKRSSKEAISLLRSYIPHLLQRDIHSWKLFEKSLEPTIKFNPSHCITRSVPA